MMTRLRTTPDETNAGRSATAPQSTRIAQGVFKLCPRAENPLRTEQQDGDEDDEDADLAEALSQPQPADRFDHADDEAAEQRAGEAAHAAQHDDGEGDQHEAVSDLRIDVVRGQQEARGGAEAREPDTEAHRENVLDVDADQLRALAFPGYGPDRAPEVAARDEREQDRRGGERAEEGDDFRRGDHRAGDSDGRERVGRLDGARVRVPRVQREILQDEGEPERGE